MTDHPSLEDLLITCSPDDPPLVDALVDEYRPRLYRLALAVLRDADESEDALQVIFLSILGHLGSYQRGTNFRAWVYTIALNTCRGILRKQKARSIVYSLLGREHLLSGALVSVEEAVLRSETCQELWASVDRLDEKLRIVVHLRYQQDLPVSEIAAILHIPEKTVYNRLYEAMRRLRKELDSGVVDGAASKVKARRESIID